MILDNGYYQHALILEWQPIPISSTSTVRKLSTSKLSSHIYLCHQEGGNTLKITKVQAVIEKTVQDLLRDTS
ncbi:unnamed protein product [Cylicocyclus nassatus]|uniref:Uncharacterized protein n=1 Tax=Cylicocyclus nassatus TaxID=53992 RepID=A0AA36DQS2_CYLNA|nr:unnamed protein product [Cylicocyclus nassatus]